LNAKRSFSSRPPFEEKAERPPTNSWKSTVPEPLEKVSDRNLLGNKPVRVS
jgi:hypothetical protein